MYWQELEDLEPNKQQAILALVSGATKREAAKAAGIGESTLYRWLREDPEFKHAYTTAKREALEEATRLLHKISYEVVQHLFDIASSPRQAPTARVAAGAKLLDLAYRASELDQVKDEIAKLKAEIGLPAA